MNTTPDDRPTEPQTDAPETLGSPSRKSSLLKQLVVGLLLVGVFTAFVVYNGRTAPTPDVFLENISLVEAMDIGTADDKPVFAVVTADWCPPCQSFKRGALADERVQQWLDANAVAVMVDATNNIPRNDALLLNDPRSIPMTAMFRGGQMVDAFTGPMSADRLLDWLEAKGEAETESDASG